MPEEGLATDVAVGDRHSCYVLAEGSIYCSGSNSQFSVIIDSERVLGSPFQSLPPVGLSDLVAVAAGSWHNCALGSDGQVVCWDHYLGETRVSSTTISLGPRFSAQPPADLAAVNQLALGGFHSCALLEEAAVQCWGDDRRGQGASFAQAVNQLGPVRHIAMGLLHSCAVLSTGAVFCAGNNGSTEAVAAAAVVPAGLPPAETLALGDSHSCAMLSTGGVQCWGENTFGQTDPPVDLGAISHLAAGAAFNCVILRNDDSVRCWGDNSNGQLLVSRELTTARLLLNVDATQLIPGQSARLEFALISTQTVSAELALIFGGTALPGLDYQLTAEGGLLPVAGDMTVPLSIAAGSSTAVLIVTALPILPPGSSDLTVQLLSSTPTGLFFRGGGAVQIEFIRQLSTVTISVAGDLRRAVPNGLTSVTVHLRLQLSYPLGQPAPSTTIRLTVISSDDGAQVGGGGFFRSGPTGLTETMVTVLLGTARSTTLSFTISEPTVDTTIAPEVFVFVDPELSTIEIVPLPDQVQQRPFEALNFSVTVMATGSDGLPIDASGSVLTLLDPVTGLMTTRVLSFINGVAVAPVEWSLSRPGYNQRLMLIVRFLPENIVVERTIKLIAAPVLSTLTVTATPNRVTPISGSDRRLLQLRISASYLAGIVPPPVEVTLTVVAAHPGVQLSGERERLVTGPDGVVATTLTVVLGDVRATTLTVTVASAQDRVATVGDLSIPVVVVPELAAITILPLADPVQTAVFEPLRFGVTVQALGSDDRPFDPSGLALSAFAPSNSAVSTWALVFADGAAISTVVWSLARQGFDQTLVLSVSGLPAGFAVQSTVNLVAAQVLSTLTVTASPARLTPISGSDSRLLQLRVAAGYLIDTELPVTEVTLTVVASDEGVQLSRQAVKLVIGPDRAAETTLTVVLGDLRSTTLTVTAVSGSDRGTVVGKLLVPVELVPVLAAVTILPLADPVQSSQLGPVNFDVTVVALGSDGLPFNPSSTLALVARGPADDPFITKGPLVFTAGTATVTLNVPLTRPGYDQTLELTVEGLPEGLSAQRTLNLIAIELLSTVVITANGLHILTVNPIDRTARFSIRVVGTGTKESDFDVSNLQLVATVSSGTVSAVDLSNGGMLSPSITATGAAQATLTVTLPVMGGDAYLSVTVQTVPPYVTVVPLSLLAVNNQILLAKLTVLTVSADSTVTQTVPGNSVRTGITVMAFGSDLNPFLNASFFRIEPQFQILASASDALQITFDPPVLEFGNGAAAFTTLTATGLNGVDAQLLLTVSGNFIPLVRIEPTQLTIVPLERLQSLQLFAPDSVMQAVPFTTAVISVTVRATGSKGNPFVPTIPLQLQVNVLPLSTHQFTVPLLFDDNGVAMAAIDFFARTGR